MSGLLPDRLPVCRDRGHAGKNWRSPSRWTDAAFGRRGRQHTGQCPWSSYFPRSIRSARKWWALRLSEAAL